MKRVVCVFCVCAMLLGCCGLSAFGAETTAPAAANGDTEYFSDGSYAVERVSDVDEAVMASIKAYFDRLFPEEPTTGGARPSIPGKHNSPVNDRQIREAITELFGGAVLTYLQGSTLGNVLNVYSLHPQSTTMAKKYDYYDAKNTKLWTLTLLAVFEGTQCVAAYESYDIYDNSWRVTAHASAFSGTRATADFTIKRYLGLIPVDTRTKHLEVDAPGGKGDINGDGKVTSVDARLALRYAARLQSLTASQLSAGDMDGDGKLRAADARHILRIAARLEK